MTRAETGAMYLDSQNLDELTDALIVDCFAFLPELILCVTIVLLLVLRMLPSFKRVHLGWIALLFTLAALAISVLQWTGAYGELIQTPKMLSETQLSHDMFGGMLVYDNFTIFIRLFLFSFAVLLIWLTLLTRIPDREDSADFYTLILGSTIGMSLMASANHLLMVYIAIEMASLPSYALAGFLKGKRQSSEAALKYVVYGGGAAGIMLYGISLLAGKFGTAYLPNLAFAYVTALHGGGFDPVLVLGTLFFLIGLGFKLAAVPFHFWCPDVFEGASAEVAAFLSVASKGAALALLGRFVLVLAGLSGERPSDFAAWSDVARYMIPTLAVFAAITATFGNLAAYVQTNLKRLLAYSTIAHAGYMMMGFAVLSKAGVSAVLFYLIAYLFMNLGAFAIVAFLRNQTGSEDLSAYRGMVYRSPVATVLLAVFLLSLLGIPPLAGFAAKFQIFSVLFDAGRHYTATNEPTFGFIMYALLVIGGINTVLSAVYYIKVLKVMTIDRLPDDVPDADTHVPLPIGSALYGSLLAAMVVVVFLAWDPLGEASNRGVDRFHSIPSPVRKAEVKP
jgi:NADH-quinone oxidoreductase subunit N